MTTWKEKLAGKLSPDFAPDLESEIDIFETQIQLRRQGKMDEKIFAETRLRRGVYGQRYDNGQRHDGVETQELPFPSAKILKGPETMWDAPGMQRIKLPFGGLNPDQMNTLANLSEEYSDGICHVTTRQDIQLHFVHIDDTPNLMRRLAAVGITTREACGNSIRNVTACPLAGVCRDESFDVTPYAKACAKFLLGHPDVQDFGRKFKIAFSGCKQHACGLVTMHDMGCIAVKHVDNGQETRGFEFYVGGGLGTVPYQAKLFDKFLPEEELLPMTQAISRVFARLGEKKNRARARIKFLVSKLGIEEFRRLVLEERHKIPEDPRWKQYIQDVPSYHESVLKEGTPTSGLELPDGFGAWCKSNVSRQRQEGYVVVTVKLPLGDISADQMRKLGYLARRHVGDNVRTTVEQNILLRWVTEADVPDVYSELKTIGLGDPGAGTIVDITACPGTDTCKLGIASSRGLAAELSTRLGGKAMEFDEALNNLRIKVSGCFNSCGQHHVADIGFYGISRTVNGYKVPHFQVLLGGKWVENGGSYGLAIGAVPSRRIPEALSRITERYLEDRKRGESFQDLVSRVGKKSLREMLEDLTVVPGHDEDSSFYSDWGDPREFTIGDMGTGECAGEVVTRVEFEFATADRQVFEAHLHLDEGEYQKADEMAYRSMLQAARTLVMTQSYDVPEGDTVVSEFRKRFYDTKLFFDKYAAGKFAQYLFHRHESPPESSRDAARVVVEEAQLFLEAARACHTKIMAQSASMPSDKKSLLKAGVSGATLNS